MAGLLYGFQIQFAYSLLLVALPMSVQLDLRNLELVGVYFVFMQNRVSPTLNLDTKWVRIVDSNQKNANGQTLRQVLIDILDKFPSYDLQSKQGSEVAIRDIESKLGTVAPSIEELTKSH